MFMQAADELGLVSRKSLWGQFWSSHQRFFKYLCIAAKVRCLVELAQKELEAGKVSTAHPGEQVVFFLIVMRQRLKHQLLFCTLRNGGIFV